MKVLFREIRAGDVAAVTARLDKKPELLHAVATAPPAKDDGQSTLQVAIKSGNFAIARLLLDRGADVHFIDASPINRWNTPVLHDAIRATVFSTRFGRNRALPGEPPRIEVLSTLERFEDALDLLQRVLDTGADPGVLDSAGNPALMRALLDARQVIDEPLQDLLDMDLRRVFAALLAAGADPRWHDARFGTTLVDHFRGEVVGRYLAL